MRVKWWLKIDKTNWTGIICDEVGKFRHPTWGNSFEGQRLTIGIENIALLTSHSWQFLLKLFPWLSYQNSKPEPSSIRRTKIEKTFYITRRNSRVAIVFLYLALWLVKKSLATPSTNKMQSYNQSWLNHTRLPALQVVCWFSLWDLNGSLQTCFSNPWLYSGHILWMVWQVRDTITIRDDWQFIIITKSR